MGRGTSSDIVAVLLIAVAATVIFAARGLWLNRSRGYLRRRPAAILWALLTIAPLGAPMLLLYGDLVVDKTLDPEPEDTIADRTNGNG